MNIKRCCIIWSILFLQIASTNIYAAQESACLSPQININRPQFDRFLQKPLNGVDDGVQGFNLKTDGIFFIDRAMIIDQEMAVQAIYKIESKSIPKKYRWQQEKIGRVLGEDNYLNFVLVEDNQITGYATFDLNLNTLARICVLSRNKGKGSQLFETVIKTLSVRGIRDFSVLSLSSAMRFYRAFALRSKLVSLAPESGWIVKYNISSGLQLQQSI